MPDYTGIVHMLVEPLLEHREQLAVHCESSCGGTKVWLRVSFSQDDKGRVFGRGGRTIQAIQQVLTAAAELAHQQLRFEIHDPSLSRR